MQSHFQAQAGEHLPRLSGRLAETWILGRGAQLSVGSAWASCFPRWPPPIIPTFRPWLSPKEVSKPFSVPLCLGKQRSWHQPSMSHGFPRPHAVLPFQEGSHATCLDSTSQPHSSHPAQLTPLLSNGVAREAEADGCSLACTASMGLEARPQGAWSPHPKTHHPC